MQPTYAVGVDPGIVHSGVVDALFVPKDRTIWIEEHVVLGTDELKIRNAIYSSTTHLTVKPNIFVEGYRPRKHMSTDKRMVEAVANIRKALPGCTVLDNTGIKKVVKPALLNLLGLDTFHQPTHHDDLRSAGRILVLGMLKDEEMNKLLADIVLAHLTGAPWHVEH